MKEIKLNRIVLSNWKSRNVDITFNDKRTNIHGRNRLGKTSIRNAWCWLLTGYTNAYSPKNHELFDNTLELSHETPIASVKAWISIDGLEYTIQKTAQAKFTRKKGTNEYIKDGSDNYKTYIDEIEISATDFTAWVEHNICPYDMLGYCLDGSFFAVLADDDRRKARKVLENIVGEIKASDFKGDYSALKDDFAKGYSIEQIEEKAKNHIRPLRERMIALPTLISDKGKTLAEYNDIDFASIEKEIAEKKQTISSIDDAILGKSESIQPILGKRDAIYEIINSKTLKLNECRNTYVAKFKATTSEIKGKISEVQAINAGIQLRNTMAQTAYEKKCSELSEDKASLESMMDYREVLLKRKNDLKAQVFNGESCPYCKQELPAEMLEIAKERFNKQKKEDLDFIISQGKKTTARIIQLQEKVNNLQLIVDAGCTLEAKESTEIYEEELREHEKSFVPFENTDEYAMLIKEIEDIKATLPEIPTSDTTALTNTKKSLLDALETLNQSLGIKCKADDLKTEIDALKCELRNIGNELGKQEMILDKCKEYVEERANIISERINGKLKDTAIQMWQVQKNGELTPSCTITDKSGVKYSTLNNSNRIKTCIELQQMFCKYYDITLPIFIDEYHAFDSFNAPTIDSQYMCLFASDSPVLVVE